MSFALLLMASGTLGALVLGPLKLGNGFEANGLRLLTGLCLAAVLIMAVGSFSLAAAHVVLVCVVVGGIALLLRRRRASRASADLCSPAAPLEPVEWVALAATGVALALALIAALAPVTSWDATTAHLALPTDYVRAGYIHVFEGNPYSAFPHLLHSLFTFGYCLDGELGATLVNWTFACLGCVALYGLGTGLAGRRAGFIAAAMFATAPIFMDQAGTVSIDLAFATVTAFVLCALLAWRDADRTAWLILAGLLAGSACGIRHTGYVVCVLLCVGVLLAPKVSRLKAASLFAACCVVGAVPWMLRSWILAGNPVYPFFWQYFTPDGIVEVTAESVGTHDSLRGTGLGAFLLFPWRIVMRPDLFDGWAKSPGGLVLILGIPGLFVAGKRGRALGAFSGAGVAALFAYRQLARYYLPFFVPMMAVAAAGASNIRALRKPIAALLVVMFAYGLALHAAAVHFKIPVALGLESRDDYLQRRVERYDAFQWLNESWIPEAGGRVLMLDTRSYFAHVDPYQNPDAVRRLAGMTPEGQLDWLRARDIRFVFYPQAYIEESPSYGETGQLAMFDAWRADTAHFHLVKRLELDRARESGTEVVEIYEIR
ncbi:MAG: hypothetical protein GY851_22790 [bacterium]|nr:hypothetical protein [bacterium]